jgi:ABC-type oligopeptide transport system substrate-binding subunit
MKLNTRRKLKKIALISCCVLATAGAGIGIGTSFLRKVEDNGFSLSLDSSFTSLNYNRVSSDTDGNIRYLYQNLVDGLFFNNGSYGNDTIAKVLGYTSPLIARIGYAQYSRLLVQNTDIDKKEVEYSKLSEAINSSSRSEIYPGISSSVATDSIDFVQRDDPSKSNRTIVDIDIRLKKEAIWENGDQVGAEDFVDSLWYAINPKNISENASLGSPIFNYTNCSIYLQNSKQDLDKVYWDPSIESDNSCKKLFDDSIVPLDNERRPIVLSKRNLSREQIAKGEYGEKTKFLRIRIDLGVSSIVGGTQSNPTYNAPDYPQLVRTIGRNELLFPVNKKFIESINGGYQKFGTSRETFLSNGPYKIADFEFDYQLHAVKNPKFWDSARTLSESFKMLVIKRQSTAQSLFRTGKINNTQIPPELYATFSRDSKIAQKIYRGQSAGLLRGYFFNTYGPNSQYTSNVHFRNAIKYAIDREQLVAASDVTGTIPATNHFVPESFEQKTTNGAGLFEYLIERRLSDGSYKPFTYSLPLSDKNNLRHEVAMANLPSAEARGLISRNNQIDRSLIQRDLEYNPALARYEFEKFLNEVKPKSKPKIVVLFQNSGTSKAQAYAIKSFVEKNLEYKIDINIVPQPAILFTENTREFNNKYDLVERSYTATYNSSPFTYYRLFMVRPDRNSSAVQNNISLVGNTILYNMFDAEEKNALINQIDKDIEKYSSDNNLTKEDDAIAKYFSSKYRVDWVDSQSWVNTKHFLEQWVHDVNNKIADLNNQVMEGNQKYEVLDKRMQVHTDIVKNYIQQQVNSPTSWYKSKITTSNDGLTQILENVSDEQKIDQINKNLRVIELVLKLSGLAILSYESAQTFYASDIINAFALTSLVPGAYSLRNSYKCFKPPYSINRYLPNCSALSGAESIIG